jgi:hypothetical protein
MAEQEQMVTIAARLAADKEVKALIINQAVSGTNAAVDKFLESRKRDEVFIVYCSASENPSDVSRRANFALNTNDLDMGPAMVKQAKKQGARVFVHYSFPRHLSIALLARRLDLIKQTCAAEGIQFVDTASPDPSGDAGISGAQQFILQDVPRMVARYGKDTAFFSTNCAMQIPLIKAVINNHAVFPQPCCPSPFHGFPQALGISSGQGFPDINFVVRETRRIAAANNMLGRLSTWPAPTAMTWTNAGAEYAIKWIKGEVPKTGIDEKVLMACIKAYVKELAGTDINISMTVYREGGTTYGNFFMALMGYLTY